MEAPKLWAAEKINVDVFVMLSNAAAAFCLNLSVFLLIGKTSGARAPVPPLLVLLFWLGETAATAAAVGADGNFAGWAAASALLLPSDCVA